MAAPNHEQRFRELILPHLDAAFNLACWLTRNRDEAQDLVQEAAMRAIKYFSGFHGVDGRVWLLRIVRNTFYSSCRDKGAAPETAFDEELHSLDQSGGAWPEQARAGPDGVLMQRDCDRMVHQALAKLPLEFREVVVMRELEELSYKEIAAIAGIPIGTVMSRLGRGRKLLAKCLDAAVRGNDGP